LIGHEIGVSPRNGTSPHVNFPSMMSHSIVLTAPLLAAGVAVGSETSVAQ
jgi:hypothetical protein